MFKFEDLHANNTFKELWEVMFLCLTVDTSKCINKECLMCIRLLRYNKQQTHFIKYLICFYLIKNYFNFSRDKTHLNEIITEKHVNILLQCANLMEDSLCIIITTENTDGKIANNLIKNINYIS